MSENLKGKVNAIGERLKINGAEMGRKMSAGMSTMSFKMKEFFQEPNQADKLVADATSESLDYTNWDIILHLCDLINADKIDTCDVVRAIKKRVMMKSPRGQYLALVLLEMLVKNCDKGFFEVATERVLDEMVKIVDDPDQSFVASKEKALMMIRDWGESTTELRYLPVYEETYKSLKSRGIRFPDGYNESKASVSTPSSSASAPMADLSLEYLIDHDTQPDLTLAKIIQCENLVPCFTSQQTKEAFVVARNIIHLLSSVLHKDTLKQDSTITLLQQCRESQSTVHKIIETVGNNEALLYEALNVNDEIHKVLSKYEELKKKSKVSPLEPELNTMIPVAIEPDESPHFREENLIRKPSCSRTGVQGLSHDDMMDDLDEMIFGKKGGDASQWGQDPKNQQQSSKYDFISL
ncbi:TOM1-like protein 1 [Trifolium pratense]|uniref:TOM1-like protein 1 n=1 Tax=Trifolium pratense TaxID=57577 RepID=UPI001E69479D|nr:TOM1-like protein 1 [Trifolium pratense]